MSLNPMLDPSITPLTESNSLNSNLAHPVGAVAQFNRNIHPWSIVVGLAPTTSGSLKKGRLQNHSQNSPSSFDL